LHLKQIEILYFSLWLKPASHIQLLLQVPLENNDIDDGELQGDGV
jgi:hypothetical protein